MRAHYRRILINHPVFLYPSPHLPQTSSNSAGPDSVATDSAGKNRLEAVSSADVPFLSGYAGGRPSVQGPQVLERFIYRLGLDKTTV